METNLSLDKRLWLFFFFFLNTHLTAMSLLSWYTISSLFFFFFLMYLFIWLYQLLVDACGI